MDNEIIIASSEGKCIRFHEDSIRIYRSLDIFEFRGEKIKK